MDQTNIVQGQKLVQCRKGNGTRGENSLQFRKLDQKCTKVLWACVKILKKKNVRRPGIEPGSTAWKATMLTFTPPTRRLITTKMNYFHLYYTVT